MISEPLIILSICIGALNILERMLRRTNKYQKLLEKINKSRERLIEISIKNESVNDSDNLLLDCLELIDNVFDATDICFNIPE